MKEMSYALPCTRYFHCLACIIGFYNHFPVSYAFVCVNFMYLVIWSLEGNFMPLVQSSVFDEYVEY